MIGRPTLVKCKKIQLKRQEQEELADLDVSNIISSGKKFPFLYLYFPFPF